MKRKAFSVESFKLPQSFSDRVDPAVRGAEGPEGQPCAEGEVQESLRILRISPKTYTTMSTRWAKGGQGVSGSSQDLSWQGLQRHENPEFSLVHPFYLHVKCSLEQLVAATLSTQPVLSPLAQRRVGAAAGQTSCLKPGPCTPDPITLLNKNLT